MAAYRARRGSSTRGRRTGADSTWARPLGMTKNLVVCRSFRRCVASSALGSVCFSLNEVWNAWHDEKGANGEENPQKHSTPSMGGGVAARAGGIVCRRRGADGLRRRERCPRYDTAEGRDTGCADQEVY